MCWTTGVASFDEGSLLHTVEQQLLLCYELVWAARASLTLLGLLLMTERDHNTKMAVNKAHSSSIHVALPQKSLETGFDA